MAHLVKSFFRVLPLSRVFNPICHVFAYIRADAHEGALNYFTFLSYELGKGQYTFYPLKLSHFLEEKKHLRMNVAPDQTIILGLQIFLDHR